VLDLPSRLVESLIAASILYVAAENLAVGRSRLRWYLTFGFGLVHGLGFAYNLKELLPPQGKIVPLLLFNLGIEIGQLVIVAVLLPGLYLVARRGAKTYRSLVVNGVSALVGMAAMVWLVERVFRVTLLGGVLGG